MRHFTPRAPGTCEASISDTSHSFPASSMNSRASRGSMERRIATSRSRITPLSAANSAPSYEWEAMLRYLAPRCTPGVEVVSGLSYARTFGRGWFVVTNLDVVLSPHRDSVLAKIRRLFDVDTDVSRISRALSADPLLAPLIQSRPGLRVAGAMDRFELALRAVLGQQVSVAAASTFSGRLAAML